MNSALQSPQAAGRVVFLIDESESLRDFIAGGTKSKAESIATAVNSLLNQLTAVPNLELAIAGYRNDGSNGADVRCRWSGPLAGKRFVSSWHLAENPVAIENRVRKLPVPNASGMLEESIRFPIWYVPQLGGAIFPVIGYGYCQHLVLSGVTAETPWVKPPLVISFVGDWMSQQVELAVERVLHLESPAGPPLLMHVHLGGIGSGRPMLYPSTDQHMTTDAQKVLFRWSSALPDYMLAALRDAHVSVVQGARAMIYNATVADLIRLLGLVKAYAANLPVAPRALAMPPVLPHRKPNAKPQASTMVARTEALDGLPQRTAFNPTCIQKSLVVLLLDRSIGNPADDKQRQLWSRLPDAANDMLALIAKKGQDCVDAALVSYGQLSNGQTELRTTFDGPLNAKTIVSATELAAGALRVDEVQETIPNGIGGLISFTRKRAIYIDLEPLAPAREATVEAFAHVIRLIKSWRGDRPAAEFPAVVVHLTRGVCDAAQLGPSVEALHSAGAILYHHVVTLSPHRSLSYPDSVSGISDPSIVQLWKWSSPLLGAASLAAEKKVATSAARGIVINAKLDLLLEGIVASVDVHAPA